MRSNSRRSFTVELKTSGRRHGTTIPSRVAAPATAAPRAFQAAPSQPAEPAAEKRRILPSLIAPEVPQTEPTIAEVQPPRRGRGRPRKLPPTGPIAVEEGIEEPAEAISAAPPAVEEPSLPARAPRRLPAKPADALAPGERWKRRLGRWSR